MTWIAASRLERAAPYRQVCGIPKGPACIPNQIPPIESDFVRLVKIAELNSCCHIYFFMRS